jgi:hypothetical protein
MLREIDTAIAKTPLEANPASFAPIVPTFQPGALADAQPLPEPEK